jgi:hypothetical protein
MNGWHKFFENKLKHGMDTGKKNNNESPRESSNLPATEIVKNDNPRANENIRERTSDDDSLNQSSSDVGSEITDGEDA